MGLERLRPTEELARQMGKPRAASAVPWITFQPGGDDVRRLAVKAERVLRGQARFTNTERDLILARFVLDARA